MKLRDVLLEVQCLVDCPDIEINGVTDDSRNVAPGSLFVALQGGHHDGLDYAQQALKSGAAVVLAASPAPAGVDAGRWLTVPDPRALLGPIAHAIAGHPSRGLAVAGVTGTNGKTTTTWLLDSIFRANGNRTALLGTLFYRIGDEEFPAPNTTASACRNAELFAEMRDHNLQAVAMEVSSHAIDQRRIAGIEFNVGVLTNITQDHLDYHQTMEKYAEAKWRFFEETIAPSGAVAVFNMDDAYSRQFSQRYGSRQIRFSQKKDVEVELVDVTLGLHGIEMLVNIYGQPLHLRSRLLGRFNVENILAAVSAATALGLDRTVIAKGIAQSQGVPGRFERIDEGQPFLAAVDYAHTPDALERALANAREMTPGRVIAVFGCGGDRDPGKRRKMGYAVGKGADVAILTTDNPRSEDPAEIARMAEAGLIEAGARNYRVVLDRTSAIEEAMALARNGDFVLIAGKGHETYQEVNGVRHHFDDREVAREVLRNVAASKETSP